MYRKTIYMFVAASMLFFVTTHVALAWPGQPPERATISGRALEGEVEINDADVLRILRLGGIEDFNAGTIDAPKNPGEGFKVTRYFYEGTFNFGMLTYYPNTPRSFVYFEDGPQLEGDHTMYNKQWLYATLDGDAAMRKWLADHGVSLNGLPPAESKKEEVNPIPQTGSADTASTNFTIPVLLVVEAGIAIIIGLTGGWLFWRRTRAR